MSHVSILLVENSLLFRSALASILHRLGFSVITSDRAGPQKKPGKQHDLVLFDLVTFPGRPEELTESVKQYSDAAPVLLLAREDHLEHVVAGIKAGAVGFVKQTASPRELRTAIKTIVSGDVFCDKKLFRRIVQYLPVVSYGQQASLTKREEEILRHVTTGQTNKQIAQRLSLSEQSIKVHVSSLLRKTGTSNRSGLALYAVARGLVGA